MSQPVDTIGQSGQVSSCQANGDTAAAQGALALGLGPAPDPRPALAPATGGGLRARETPPPPRAKGTPPPVRQELTAAGSGTLGVRGASAGRGLGMDAAEQERKLREIARIRSIEELDGYANGVEGVGGAARRGYFEGEKAAIDLRLRQLHQAKAVEARMGGRRA